MYIDNGAVMLSGSVRLVLWLTMANGPSTDNAESGAVELVNATGRVVVR